MQWLTLSWTLALLSAGANGFLPINPGIGVQIKTRQKPSDTILQLHPSLSSPTYLAAASNSKSQPSPGNLRRVRTNFQVDVDAAPIVRIASSSDHDGLAPLEDNLFSASNTVPAPYSSLPDSYRNIHPVSYYATHTYVPPIKNLYKDDTNNKEASLKETPRGAEGTREIPSPVRNNALNDATTSDESRSSTIVSHEQPLPTPSPLSSQDYEQFVDEPQPESIATYVQSRPSSNHVFASSVGSEDDNSFEGASPETVVDFIPSKAAPQLPKYDPYHRLQRPIVNHIDSNFGVSVTPITVDQNGLKREIKGSGYVEKKDVYVKISRPSVSAHNHRPKSGYGTGRRRKPPRKSGTKYYVAPNKVDDYLDQLAVEGYKRQTFVNSPIPESANGVTSNSLLYLAPSGPSMPVFSRLTNDLSSMVTGIMHGPVREMTQTLANADQPIMSRVGVTLHKMMGGHMGDRTFDVFDWIPLVALLVATGLILSGIFPGGLNTFGLTNGSLVVGRSDEEEDSIMGKAMNHLESGVLMISALRHEDGCSQRLACRLGKMAKDSDFLTGDTGEAILGAVNAVLPDTFNSFARSFRDVATEEDESSCKKECYRCISI